MMSNDQRAQYLAIVGAVALLMSPFVPVLAVKGIPARLMTGGSPLAYILLATGAFALLASILRAEVWLLPAETAGVLLLWRVVALLATGDALPEWGFGVLIAGLVCCGVAIGMTFRDARLKWTAVGVSLLMVLAHLTLYGPIGRIAVYQQFTVRHWIESYLGI
jgi:hypothetical protein